MSGFHMGYLTRKEIDDWFKRQGTPLSDVQRKRNLRESEEAQKPRWTSGFVFPENRHKWATRS